MQIWAVANQKGGVGKTTTVITLAGLLAKQEYRVLVVDLDPHSSLTSYLGYDSDELEHSIYELFIKDNLTSNDIISLLQKSSHQKIDLLPSSTLLATIEQKTSVNEGMGNQLATALKQIEDCYDYVILDTPPILGVLMINALVACQHLLIPVQTEFLALKGLERMVQTLKLFNQAQGKELKFTIIPTFYDRRTQIAANSLQQLQANYANNISKSIIPVDTKLRDASIQGAAPSMVDTRGRGVRAYSRLLRTLLEK